jgi:hypothetical protein
VLRGGHKGAARVGAGTALRERAGLLESPERNGWAIAHAEGLSLQQAQRDLRDLVSADILEPVGRTRARYYREGLRFPQPALAEARTPMAITSPYSG